MMFPDRHDWRATVRGVVFLVALAVAINVVMIAARAHGAEFSRDTTRLPLRLQAALAQVNAACGITIDNTWRKDATIAGTNRPSQHRYWRAADFTTKAPACVRRVLADWNGCLSIDYKLAHHFHIDTSGSRKCRFAHGGGGHRHATHKGARVAHFDQQQELFSK